MAWAQLQHYRLPSYSNVHGQALEASPSADAYEHRAHAYIKLEKYIEAVQDATKAIELDSKNAKAHLRKG